MPAALLLKKIATFLAPAAAACIAIAAAGLLSWSVGTLIAALVIATSAPVFPARDNYVPASIAPAARLGTCLAIGISITAALVVPGPINLAVVLVLGVPIVAVSTLLTSSPSGPVKLRQKVST